MAVVALGAIVGQQPTVACHVCGVPAFWRCEVRLDEDGKTIGYAVLYHCLAHRPESKATCLAADVVAPPPSTNWRVVNGTTDQP